MVFPVWMDGPLDRARHEVSDEVIEQGMYRYTERDVYTFTLVSLLEHRVVVASVRNGIPDPHDLFNRLLTTEAREAAG